MQEPGGSTPAPDTTTQSTAATQPTDRECAALQPDWIFCDDFEIDRLNTYFEYNKAGTSFTRTSGIGVNNSWGMRTNFAQGQTEAGSLKLAFGRTPSSYFRPADAGTATYREIYWRVYIRNDSAWTGGGGDKLSRAQVIANSAWAQAMVAPVWSGGSTSNRDYLLLDPSTGTNTAGTLVATKYNDFANHRYLGSARGTLPLFSTSNIGGWYCVEARVRLNDAGQSNGIFEFWIDNQLQASRINLNLVGQFTTYGVNVVFFENYWNAGSPKAQSRYMDNIVVSTSRIGC